MWKYCYISYEVSERNACKQPFTPTIFMPSIAQNADFWNLEWKDWTDCQRSSWKGFHCTILPRWPTRLHMLGINDRISLPLQSVFWGERLVESFSWTWAPCSRTPRAGSRISCFTIKNANSLVANGICRPSAVSRRTTCCLCCCSLCFTNTARTTARYLISRLTDSNRTLALGCVVGAPTKNLLAWCKRKGWRKTLDDRISSGCTLQSFQHSLPV